MATYTISKTASGDVDFVVTGAPTNYPKRTVSPTRIKERRISRSEAAAVVIELVDGTDYTIFPATDTLILAGTTYAAGSNTKEQLYDILKDSTVFQKANPGSGGPGEATTDASQLTTGTLSDARLSANITKQGNTFNGVNQLVKTDGTGKLPAIDGSLLTNLPAGGTTDYNALSNKPTIPSTLDQISDTGTRVAVTPAQKAAIGTNTTAITANATLINSRLQTETQDYLTRVIAAGGRIDALSIHAIDKFISRGKNAGWFTAIKQCWVPVGDLTASKVFLVTPSGITPAFNNFVAADYTQEAGYRLTSNTNKYIDTGFIPNNNGVTSSNISMGVCTLSDDLPTTFAFLVGCTPATNVKPNPYFSNGDAKFGVVGSEFTTNYGGEGHITIGHYGATASGSVQNGALCTTGTTTPAVAMDSAMTIFRTWRENLAAFYYATASVGFYFMGTDINDTMCIDMSRAVEDLMFETGRTGFRKPVGLMFGDSITAKSGATSGQNMRRGWSKLFCNYAGLREKNAGQGSSRVISDNTVNGQTFVRAISRYTTIADFRPGVMVMMYGTNDMAADAATNGTSATVTTYTSNLNTIIAGFINTGHKVVLVSPPYRNDKTAAFQQLWIAGCAAAAKTNNVPFADIYNAFIDTGTPATFVPDNVHPNDAGHLIVAQYAYEAYLGRLIRKPTLDYPSIAAGTSADLTVTVYNAVPGMSVSLGLPAALETGLVANAFVSANDTVTVRLTNITASAIDPASAQYKVTVFTNY